MPVTWVSSSKQMLSVIVVGDALTIISTYTMKAFMVIREKVTRPFALIANPYQYLVKRLEVGDVVVLFGNKFKIVLLCEQNLVLVVMLYNIFLIL